MSVRNLLRSARSTLGLSPMQRVLRKLERKGVTLGELHALEVFGGAGTFHARDYARRVAALDVWEIDSRLEAPLRRNLPEAKITITDSYEELKNASKRYGLVVIDNPMSLHGGHCEHFDLFPEIFRLMADRAVLILDVIPAITPRARKRFPYLFNTAQLAERSRFYRTDHPEHIPLEKMIAHYTNLASENGFGVEQIVHQRRHFVYYLGLVLSSYRLESEVRDLVRSS